MDFNSATESKKRSLAMVASQELSWKFKSKKDLVNYIDKQ